MSEEHPEMEPGAGEQTAVSSSDGGHGKAHFLSPGPRTDRITHTGGPQPISPLHPYLLNCKAMLMGDAGCRFWRSDSHHLGFTGGNPTSGAAQAHQEEALQQPVATETSCCK